VYLNYRSSIIDLQKISELCIIIKYIVKNEVLNFPFQNFKRVYQFTTALDDYLVR